MFGAVVCGGVVSRILVCGAEVSRLVVCGAVVWGCGVYGYGIWVCGGQVWGLVSGAVVRGAVALGGSCGGALQPCGGLWCIVGAKNSARGTGRA